ncbi:hypothetical protein AB0L06_24610 [Spirillospora sp. NPDC052269]
MPARTAEALDARREHLVTRRLPQVTALFWALKIVAVTLGETAGDLVGITLGLGYVATEALFLGGFLVVLAIQLRTTRFRPAVFWTVVLGTSLVGTEMSDLLDRGPGHGGVAHGLGYGWGALVLSGLLALVFLVWWRTGQSRDVENISSRTGEALYWTAILVSNSLGTAGRDVRRRPPAPRPPRCRPHFVGGVDVLTLDADGRIRTDHQYLEAS